MTSYTTRNEAIEFEIVAAIEAGDATAAEFDIDAIAEAVLTTEGEGSSYRWILDEDADFWAAVAANAC